MYKGESPREFREFEHLSKNEWRLSWTSLGIERHLLDNRLALNAWYRNAVKIWD